MKGIIVTTLAAGGAIALTFCGCTNAGKAKGTVPIEDYHGGMAHQSIYAGKPMKAAGQAMVELEPASGSNVRGSLVFTPDSGGVRVEGSITGLTPGKHGLHIHENGDCSSPDAKSAGDHFNPTHEEHGGPDSEHHHVGDFGNITADATGVAAVSRVYPGLTLQGPDSIIGKAVIVHDSEDDLTTQPAGNSGARVACGVIQLR